MSELGGVPYFNTGAGPLQTESGRDMRRAELRRMIAAGRQVLRDNITLRGERASEMDRYLIENQIAKWEQLIDHLGRLKYRNGLLVQKWEE